MGIAHAFRVCIILLGLRNKAPLAFCFAITKTHLVSSEISLFGLQMAALLPPLYLVFLCTHTSQSLCVSKFPSLGEMLVILNEGPPVQPHSASATTL